MKCVGFVWYCPNTDLKLVKKFTRPNFRAKEFYTLKTCTYIKTIFASNKQRKCIIISNLALFWLKLNKMCKFFNSYEESLHLGVCKLAKYVRNCIVFWKKLHSLQKIYTTASRGGRDKFQVCFFVVFPQKKIYSVLFLPHFIFPQQNNRSPNIIFLFHLCSLFIFSFKSPSEMEVSLCRFRIIKVHRITGIIKIPLDYLLDLLDFINCNCENF